MLYRILKFFLRPALPLFCRKIFISDPAMLQEKGPLLLACNHPNSFLDAIILDLLFEQPVWSLARGDVFKKTRVARLLHALKILPVYRTSEGVENLSENYKTFDACLRLFRQNGIVLIFSEGKCINEWHLRPLKKGTARLAVQCWEEGIPLRVLPVGINYSSFRRFGKNVYLCFGDIITSSVIREKDTDGQRNQAFNRQLQAALKPLVFEIPKADKPLQEQKLAIPVPAVKKALLFLPAAAGLVLHWPLYGPLKKFAWKKTNHNDHYDSVLVSLLLFLYPFYLLLLAIPAFFIMQSWFAFLLFLLLPFCAWSCIQLKPQLDK
ncbi:MAG: 1-acyl-sn-glycerol-3-phosphate acyltransferase [Chitinophagaceae bacterium]